MPQQFILFIVKKLYHYEGHTCVSTGLKNSSLFIADMLLTEGVRAKLVEAVDGNSIDALVAAYKPSRVVLEAIWATPAKLAELVRLHPSVEWTVRVHSEVPFLANEGVTIQWISEYLRLGVEVAFNSARAVEDFAVLGAATWLPNYYPLRKPRTRPSPSGELNVGCFGAVRPLKNQLIQAFAAVRCAKETGRALRFHMNGARIEQNGLNNLKQIKALLAATGQTLVLHPWLDHQDFLELVAEMDVCLQVSLSESFNIVSADAASMGVPLVGSSAIDWLPRPSRAPVDSSAGICAKMLAAGPANAAMNAEALRRYLDEAVAAWRAWAGA